MTERPYRGWPDETLTEGIKQLSSWARRNPYCAQDDGNSTAHRWKLMLREREIRRRMKSKKPYFWWTVPLSFGAVKCQVQIQARTRGEAFKLVQDRIIRANAVDWWVAEGNAQFPIGQMTIQFRPQLVSQNQVVKGEQVTYD
jgi:hypothetical protein